jgi:tRNA-specific 2-thiouridylase
MNSNNKNITVAVAMSGGVDSSVAAILLKKQGYNVVGINGVMNSNGMDSAEKAIESAKAINIPIEVVDLTSDFNECVIKYFENAYNRGLTPNPCTICNRKIKWGKLIEHAKNKFGANFYATGHYANIINENSNYKLYKAQDLNKDQIYMLFNLTQDDLAKTMFPLGKLTKPEVKEIARKHGLACADNKESQDICFITPPDSTKKYLTRLLGEKKGNIININTEKILGTHNGAYQYTIGQRKGIGIAAEEPLYVVSTDINNNIVYVGFKSDLACSELQVLDVNFQQAEYKNQEFKGMVKIRYNSPAKPATIIPISENTVLVKFDNPEYGVTPGQAAVFYNISNEYLIGGGWIS